MLEKCVDKNIEIFNIDDVFDNNSGHLEHLVIGLINVFNELLIAFFTYYLFFKTVFHFHVFKLWIVDEI